MKDENGYRFPSFIPHPSSLIPSNMATVAEALELALRHHHAGRLREAELIYRQVLQADPCHADALHLLGVVMYQQGQAAVAVDLVGKAVAYRPQDAGWHSDLGPAYQALGRLEEALACQEQALRLQPDYAPAHSNRGHVGRHGSTGRSSCLL